MRTVYGADEAFLPYYLMSKPSQLSLLDCSLIIVKWVRISCCTMLAPSIRSEMATG